MTHQPIHDVQVIYLDIQFILFYDSLEAHFKKNVDLLVVGLRELLYSFVYYWVL